MPLYFFALDLVYPPGEHPPNVDLSAFDDPLPIFEEYDCVFSFDPPKIGDRYTAFESEWIVSAIETYQLEGGTWQVDGFYRLLCSRDGRVPQQYPLDRPMVFWAGFTSNGEIGSTGLVDKRSGVPLGNPYPERGWELRSHRIYTPADRTNRYSAAALLWCSPWASEVRL